MTTARVDYRRHHEEALARRELEDQLMQNQADRVHRSAAAETISRSARRREYRARVIRAACQKTTICIENKPCVSTIIELQGRWAAICRPRDDIIITIGATGVTAQEVALVAVH